MNGTSSRSVRSVGLRRADQPLGDDLAADPLAVDPPAVVADGDHHAVAAMRGLQGDRPGARLAGGLAEVGGLQAVDDAGRCSCIRPVGLARCGRVARTAGAEAERGRLAAPALHRLCRGSHDHRAGRRHCRDGVALSRVRRPARPAGIATTVSRIHDALRRGGAPAPSPKARRPHADPVPAALGLKSDPGRAPVVHGAGLDLRPGARRRRGLDVVAGRSSSGSEVRGSRSEVRGPRPRFEESEVGPRAEV